MKLIFTVLLLWLYIGVAHTQDLKPKLDYLFVEVKFKGQKLKFIFDNGVSITSIRDKYIKNDKTEKIPVTDANGKKKVFNLTKNMYRLNLPSEKLKLRLLILDDVPDFFIGHNIAGILGADIINMYDWVLDFENHTATLLNKKEIDFPSFSLKINKFKNDSLVINISNPFNMEVINVPSKIDLGFSGIFSYTYSDTIFEQDSLFSISLIKTLVDKKSIVKSNILTRNMNFDGFTISNIPIVKQNSTAKRHNLLGVKFLSKFEKVILYNSKQQIWLKKQKKIHFEHSSPRIVMGVVWELLNEKSFAHQTKFTLGAPFLEKNWTSKIYNWTSKIEIIQ